MTKVKATNFAQEIVEAANMIFEKKGSTVLGQDGDQSPGQVPEQLTEAGLVPDSW